MFNNTTRFLYPPLKQDVICSEVMCQLCHEAEGTICKEKASDFLCLLGSVCTNSGGLVLWCLKRQLGNGRIGSGEEEMIEAFPPPK